MADFLCTFGNYAAPMSLAEIKEHAERLPAADRRHLTAFLVTLDPKANSSLMRKVTDSLDDRGSSRWVPLDDVERRLLE
jgi:hypothetical protein